MSARVEPSTVELARIIGCRMNQGSPCPEPVVSIAELAATCEHPEPEPTLGLCAYHASVLVGLVDRRLAVCTVTPGCGQPRRLIRMEHVG